MGLRATVASAVKAAFVAVGDIPETATYRYYHSQDPSYQPEQGYVFNPKTDYSLTMLFTQYTRREVDTQTVLMTDMKCIIQATEFSDNSIEPQMADVIIKGGKSWEIKHIYLDPTESIYILQLRRP